MLTIVKELLSTYTTFGDAENSGRDYRSRAALICDLGRVATRMRRASVLLYRLFIAHFRNLC